MGLALGCSGAGSPAGTDRTAGTSGSAASSTSAGLPDRGPAAPQTAPVELIRISDGDTLVVRMPEGGEERVRYIGIDSPELDDDRGYGERASAHNARLLQAGPLRLQLDLEARDRFGRVLAYVWAGEVFVNRQMVADGYAYVSTHPPNVRYEGELVRAQREARDAGRGLWGSGE